jgi:hypothetical protein
MKKTIYMVLIILVAACSSGQAMPTIPREAATVMELATATPIPTATATSTPTATFTPTVTPKPSSTSTPTALPEALKNEILQAYKILLFIEVDTNMLSETASRVKSGEISGLDGFGTTLALAMLVEGVDQAIAETTPPEFLQKPWDRALEIHEQTKDILSRWFNDEIDSSIVLDEIEDPLGEIEKIMSGVEEELASRYGIDPDEMREFREDTIESMNEIFNTPTPEG